MEGILYGFCLHVGAHFEGKTLQKSMPKLNEKMDAILEAIFDACWLHFGSHFEGKMLQKSMSKLYEKMARILNTILKEKVIHLEGSAERREPMGGGGGGGEAVNCNLRQNPEHAAPGRAGGGGSMSCRTAADLSRLFGGLSRNRFE